MGTKFEKKWAGQRSGQKVSADRRYYSDADYGRPLDGANPRESAAWLTVTGAGTDGKSAAATLGLDETKELIAALTAIVENVEGLLPKPPTFNDTLVEAPTGSTLLNHSNNKSFVKLENGKWVGLSSGDLFTSRGSFSNNARNYTLTPPAVATKPTPKVLTWAERLEAAPADALLTYGKIGNKYRKNADGDWISVQYGTAHPASRFSEFNYTLTNAGE